MKARNMVKQRLTRQLLLGVDAGGTFTDFVCIEIGRENSLRIHKILSTPAAPEQAIMNGLRAMGLATSVEQGDLHVIHGSTVATNATLEGNLARTVFVTNHGFGDMLQLARQTRPKLYALEFPPNNPPVSPELCLETGGRLGSDGSVIESLDEHDLEALALSISEINPEAVAINLLFSFLDDSFERAIEERIKKTMPHVFVSRSSKVLPVYKEYERGIATWLNAALGPVVSGYLKRLQEHLGNCSLQIMQSSGETIAAEKAKEAMVNLLLSGPAGGLTAIQFLSRQINTEKIISFDMGGTSTDVALLDSEINMTTEGVIGRYPVGVPMVDMQTIGAGGGSIAFIDSGGMLQVGPRSAGATPGPACYGKGGKEATVTDANLVLGRLIDGVALADNMKLDKRLAVSAIEKLAIQIELSLEDTALGIVKIATEHMAKAIRMISVNRGHDPKQFLLASFGGAGGLHVCSVAEAMQMARAIVPVYGGVLSALGMLVADQGRQFTRTVSIGCKEVRTENLEKQFEKLARHGSDQLVDEGLLIEKLVVKRSVDMRYTGQSYTLNVPWGDIQNTGEAFKNLHRTRYGYALESDTEIVNICVKVVHHGPQVRLPEINGEPDSDRGNFEEIHYGTEPFKVLARDNILANQEIQGPAIITEYTSTTFVEAGWTACADRYGNLMLSRQQ